MPLTEQSNLFSDYADRDRRDANPTRWQAQETNRPAFDGATFDEARDGEALSKQLDRVKAVMLSNDWLNLVEIARLANVPEGSAGSRVRDLRKSKHGGYSIPTKVVGRTWYYKIEL